MNEILIVNRHHKPEPNERMFYIGRGSPLGNLFVVTDKWDKKYILNLYEKWINRAIKDKNQRVIAELVKIASLVLDGSGKPVLLECFCYPKECHGEIVRKTILEAIQKKKTS